MQGLRAKVLLQPFAYGVTDRSAGLAIDLFAVLGDSAVHIEFPLHFIQMMMRNQVIGAGNCFLPAAIAYLSSKNFMKAAGGSTTELK